MTILDMIRGADSEDKIYALLTAYINALRHSENGEHVDQRLLDLPISGEADLHARLTVVFVALDIASKRLDNDMLVVYKEALAIVASALHRIHTLENNLHSLRGQNDAHPISNGTACGGV